MKKPTNKKMRTLQECEFNGENALEAVLKPTTYETLEQAIASFTVFTHPDVVKHTKNKALFRIRRARGGEKRGEIVDGVMLCDNQSPTLAFLWANGLVGKRKPTEVQFNHIYPLSQEPEYYTSLANLCMTPAFLAKLTDTNAKIINLLRYRALDIYGFFPKVPKKLVSRPSLKKSFSHPTKPNGYDNLIWAPYFPTQPCSRKALRQRIQERIDAFPQSRIALSNLEFGWLLKPKKIAR